MESDSVDMSRERDALQLKQIAGTREAFDKRYGELVRLVALPKLPRN